MRIEYSATARRDLLQIREYIAQDNEQAADRVVLRILHSVRHLAAFPELGPLWRDTGTRFLSVPGLSYRIHYQIGDSVVEVLTVTHTSRREPQLG